jgi:hypothetical protein
LKGFRDGSMRDDGEEWNENVKLTEIEKGKINILESYRTQEWDLQSNYKNVEAFITFEKRPYYSDRRVIEIRRKVI